jgi:flagella basal body P-ring formation protein FlgA
MEQTLSAEKILQIAKSEWPNRRFNLSGPKSIKILNQAVAISESKIMSSLEEVLKATQEDGQFLITIKKIQAPSTITLPDENAYLIFPDLTDANLKNPDWVRKNLSGNQRLRMTLSRGFIDETKSIPFFSIMIHFRLEEMVPVAARDIQKGEIIKESDVILAPYECCKISPPIIRETSAIIGRKSKILVRYGQAFASGSTENLRIISRGQSAQLIIRKEDLVIIGKVQALDSGSYGDVIDALYPTTKKRLRVRVVDPSTVESVN